MHPEKGCGEKIIILRIKKLFDKSFNDKLYYIKLRLMLLYMSRDKF